LSSALVTPQQQTRQRETRQQEEKGNSWFHVTELIASPCPEQLICGLFAVSRLRHLVPRPC
jgi:hypothetical protein